MLAAGFTLLLFVCWWFVGYGCLFVLRRGHLLQNMLLAPSVGTAVCVMFVFWLNRAGIPVSKFGPALGVSLLLGTVILWRRGRVIAPMRRYLPFVAIFLFAFSLIAWPMFKYGFNWVSISNDDMANYCLTAQRLSEYGYFERLAPDVLAKNMDLSAYYIFLADAGTRTGSEMLLAFVMSLSRLTSHQVFMPVIVALHLSLLSAAGALFLQNNRLRGWGLMTVFILACSAEMTVGTVYQLIAQVFGLSLLASCAVLLMLPSRTVIRSALVKQSGLLALIFSAAMVVYTEMIPFLAFACLLFWGRQLLCMREIPGIRAYLIAGLVTIVFLNSYIPAALRFMTSQTRAGSGHFASPEGAPVLYPYFLLPSGLAQFWGISPFNVIPQEPFLSSGILFGGFLLIVSVIVSFREAYFGVPVAFVSAGMFGAAAVLAFKESDYGLFKISMFIQPFLIPTLVGAWMRFTENKGWSRLA